MRNLLLQADVPALGKIGEVVKVSEGYARNYLLPNRLAVEPTPKNIERVDEERKRIEALRALELAEKRKMAERLNGVEITIISTSNEQGVLFGSVGPKEISDALKQEGYNVEPKHVLLTEHIKQVDKYAVNLELFSEVTCTISVWVAPSKESLAAMTAAKEREAQEAKLAKESEEAGEIVDALSDDSYDTDGE